MAVSDWRDIDDLIVINPELSFGDDIEESSASDEYLSFEVAKERVFKLLNYLELVALESVDDLLRRAIQKGADFIILSAHSGNFDLYFLKMTLRPVSMARLKLNRELFFSERFNEEHVSGLLTFRVPICVKMDAGMSWVLYKGFERLQLPEDEAEEEQVFLHLPKPFSSETLGDEYLEQIVRSLHSLQDVSIGSLVLPSFAYMLRLPKTDFGTFLSGFQKIQKQLHYSNLISSKIWYRLYQLLEERRESISSSDLVLSHGSFSEEGIMFSENGMYLFNWSKVRLCNRAFDLATLWLSAHSHIAWRRNLMNSWFKGMSNEQRFKDLFQVNLLYLSLLDIQSRARLGIQADSDFAYNTFIQALDDVGHLIS